MELRGVLLVVHLLSTLLMAAPFYMLVIVNERARFGEPLSYLTDRYLENIIRYNAIRCFIFQGTMVASGIWLVNASGRAWSDLLTEPALVLKWVAVVILVSLLSYIHFSVQPRIEALMDQIKPDAPVPEGVGPKISALRMRRKKLSGICLFLVLTALIMGLRVTFLFNFWLALGLVVLSALYAWRVFRNPVRLGWI